MTFLTSQRATHILNLGFHSLILFVFLSTFFFLYISQTEKKEVSRQTKKIVDQDTGKILNSVDKLDKKLTGGSINWKDVKSTGEKFSTGIDPKLSSINKHNKILKQTSIGISIGLFVILIILFIVFKFYFKLNINSLEIFLENLIIFALVGAIEFLFFKNIASQYIPITPDTAVSSIIQRVKYHINESVE